MKRRKRNSKRKNNSKGKNKMSKSPVLKKRRSSRIGEWEFHDQSRWYPCLPADSRAIQDAVESGGLPKNIQITNQYGTYSIDILSDRKARQTNTSTKNSRDLRFRFVQDDDDKKSWNCSACTFSNMSTAEICAMCGTERPAPPPPPPKKRNPWSHPKCVRSEPL